MPSIDLNSPVSTCEGLPRARQLLDAHHVVNIVDHYVPPDLHDGVVALFGRRQGAATLIVATCPRYLGGTIGDVGGTMMAGAIEAHIRWHIAHPTSRTQLIFFLDGGGVRVQEGNAALLAASDLLAALCAASRIMPTAAIVTGVRGCYGALALAAGLCRHRIMVAPSRLGLSGPKIIEKLAPRENLNSADALSVDAMHGAQARLQQQLVHQVIEDAWGPLNEALDRSLALARSQPSAQPCPPCPERKAQTNAVTALTPGLGPRWFAALSQHLYNSLDPQHSAMVGQGTFGPHTAWVLAYGPSVANPAGTLGNAQAQTLLAVVHHAINAAQQNRDAPRALVLIVDSPGQAMGVAEEMHGLHQSLAQLRQGYSDAAAAGLAVVALVVGRAISGAFLSHGLSAQRVVLLEQAGVEIRPMSEAGITRLRGQTAPDAPLADFLQPGAAYFARLGGAETVALQAPVADGPQGHEVQRVAAAVAQSITAAGDLAAKHTSYLGRHSFGARVRAADVCARLRQVILPSI